MDIKELQLRKEGVGKKKEVIVRAETKLEGLIKDKEKSVKKLESFGTDEKKITNEISTLKEEILSLKSEYDILDEKLDF